MKIKITTEQIGERLDKFLGENLKDFSRSQAQKLIKQDFVLVNNKKVTAHYKIKTEDEIEILSREIKLISKKDDGRKVRRFTIKDIEKIFEDSDYLVINKPAGLTVHGGEAISGQTLVDVLLEKYPSLAKIGEDPMRPGIVHRLDKEVSGLMVIAKTQDAFDNLKKQFQKRTVHKEYTALVFGATTKEIGEINFPIRRSQSSFKMAAIPETVKGEKNLQGAKRAITEFEILQKFINYTLLKIRIKTGRTHQIRVHMLAYGHPIVGDNLYSTKKTREQNKKLNLNRIFLVASKLAFRDLQGELKVFALDLPNELKELLKKVK